MQNRIMSVMQYEYKEQMSELYRADDSFSCADKTSVRLRAFGFMRQ